MSVSTLLTFTKYSNILYLCCNLLLSVALKLLWGHKLGSLAMILRQFEEPIVGRVVHSAVALYPASQKRGARLYKAGTE